MKIITDKKLLLENPSLGKTSPPEEFLNLFGGSKNEKVRGLLTILWSLDPSTANLKKYALEDSKEAFQEIWRQYIVQSKNYAEVQKFCAMYINRIMFEYNVHGRLPKFKPTNMLLLGMTYIKAAYKQKKYDEAKEGIMLLEKLFNTTNKMFGVDFSMHDSFKDFSDFYAWEYNDNFKGWFIGSLEKIYQFSEVEKYLINSDDNITGFAEINRMLKNKNTGRVDNKEVLFVFWKYLMQSQQRGLYRPSDDFIKNTQGGDPLVLDGDYKGNKYTVEMLAKGKYKVIKNGKEFQFKNPSELSKYDFSLNEIDYVAQLIGKIIFQISLKYYCKISGDKGDSLEKIFNGKKPPKERYRKYFNELVEFDLEQKFGRYEYEEIFKMIGNSYYDYPIMSPELLAKFIKNNKLLKGQNISKNDCVFLAQNKKSVVAKDYYLRAYQMSEDPELMRLVESGDYTRNLDKYKNKLLLLIKTFTEDDEVFWLSLSKMMFLANYYKINGKYDKAREIYAALDFFNSITDFTQKRQIALGWAESLAGEYASTHNQKLIEEFDLQTSKIYRKSNSGDSLLTTREELPVDDQVRLIWMEVNMASETYNVEKIEEIIKKYVLPYLDTHDKFNELYPQLILAKANCMAQCGDVEEAMELIEDMDLSDWVSKHIYNENARNIMQYRIDMQMIPFYIQCNEFEKAETLLLKVEGILKELKKTNIYFYNGNYSKLQSAKLDLYWKWGRPKGIEDLYKNFSKFDAKLADSKTNAEKVFIGKLFIRLMTMALQGRNISRFNDLKAKFALLKLDPTIKDNAELMIEYNIQVVEKYKLYGDYAKARELLAESAKLVFKVKGFNQKKNYSKIVNQAFAYLYSETRDWGKVDSYTSKLIYDGEKDSKKEFAVNTNDGLADEEFLFQGKLINFNIMYIQGNYQQLHKLLVDEIREVNKLRSKYKHSALLYHLDKYYRELKLLDWRVLNSSYSDKSRCRNYESELNTISVVSREHKDYILKINDTWLYEKRMIASDNLYLYGQGFYYQVGNKETQAVMARSHVDLKYKDEYFSYVIPKQPAFNKVSKDILLDIFGEDLSKWPDLSKVFVNYSIKNGDFKFSDNAEAQIELLDINEEAKLQLLEVYNQATLFIFGKEELSFDKRSGAVKQNVIKEFISSGKYQTMNMSDKRSLIEGMIELYMSTNEDADLAKEAINVLYFNADAVHTKDPLIMLIIDYKKAFKDQTMFPEGFKFSAREKGFAYSRLLTMAIVEKDGKEVERILTKIVEDRGIEVPPDKHPISMLAELGEQDEALYSVYKALLGFQIRIKDFMNVKVQVGSVKENLYDLIDWDELEDIVEDIEEYMEL